jgi:hypothetical protein
MFARGSLDSEPTDHVSTVARMRRLPYPEDRRLGDTSLSRAMFMKEFRGASAYICSGQSRAKHAPKPNVDAARVGELTSAARLSA